MLRGYAMRFVVMSSSTTAGRSGCASERRVMHKRVAVGRDAFVRFSVPNQSLPTPSKASTTRRARVPRERLGGVAQATKLEGGERKRSTVLEPWKPPPLPSPGRQQVCARGECGHARRDAARRGS